MSGDIRPNKYAISNMWKEESPFKTEDEIYQFCSDMQGFIKLDKRMGWITYLQMEELLKFNTLWFWWAMKKLEGGSE